MGSRNRKWDEVRYHQYLKEGRGQGVGPEYKPWIKVYDFPSNGTVCRIHGQKTGRIHHFMSTNELRYFFLLEWSEQILDIREQYPLADVEQALRIAQEADIGYPKDRISGFPYILTSDFMITTSSGHLIRTIKMSDELQNIRTIEKLEIERRYWKLRGIDWKVVTEKEIPVQKAKNIEWIYTSRPPDVDHHLLKGAIQEMLRLYDSTTIPVARITSLLEKKYSLPIGAGLSIYKHLLATRRIVVNMDSKIQLSCSRGPECFRGIAV